MTIAITCTCSARLEVDERFAGKTVTCPDCQKPLDVPAPARVPARRTSGFALASLVLALVGAFTLFGTVPAIVCGVLGLWSIARHPQRLAGRNLALAGIALGATATVANVLMLFLFTSSDLFSVDALLREAQWLGKLDYPPDLEVTRKELGFKIKRPSAQWGVYIPPVEGYAKTHYPDMLLALPAKSAYVVCMTAQVQVTMDFEQCQEKGIELLRDLEVTKFSMQHNPNLQVDIERGNKALLPKEENGKKTERMEMILHKTYHGQKKTFILWVIRREEDQQQFGNTRLYVIAGGAPAARFASVKKELKEAMESFQLLD
jgi:hypothetical protein